MPDLIKIIDENDLLLIDTVYKQTFAQKTEIPANTSDLTNDSNFVSDASYVHTDSNFTAAEKTKLGGVEAGAEVNVIEGVTVNGTDATVSGKKAAITVPTNNNQLTNGAGYQTAAEVTAAINSAISEITGISFEVVQTLPATGDSGTIYLVSHGGTGTNIYDEYIYVSNGWEKIGTTDIDLSSYYNTSNLRPMTNAEIEAIISGSL